MDSWSEKQLNMMINGGNQRLKKLFEEYKIDISSSNKFKTKAAIYYRECVNNLFTKEKTIYQFLFCWISSFFLFDLVYFLFIIIILFSSFNLQFQIKTCLKNLLQRKDNKFKIFLIQITVNLKKKFISLFKKNNYLNLFK